MRRQVDCLDRPLETIVICFPRRLANVNSYGALILLLNLVGGYACLTIGRRSWPAAFMLLPVALIWCAALTIQHWTLLRDPIETTEPFVLCIMLSATFPLLGSAI